ncbi:NAD(P)/FAD-dependent oxidoreductase [Cyanobium sp. Lug-B]|uniref:NAD(P)/FAD-dependent oxidoreductase n=1 Tax=Cyanobium sp. Lug-B TaxID=2823716 RepID=UPI0020CE4ED3|nr:NAD(P)/FAD-dependent oxidoreductase [Cyanobium sp. Lug-B]MCP9796654.1 NAD(P)/FAD-dependent oxidoreductase [Cyanobium sp. Lug-B]
MAKERFFLELEPSEAVMKGWPHVVIVGGGFAGLKAAHRLAAQPVRVTLVDKRNFNLFQPLLYQVASGLVSEADVATPLRLLLARAANVQVLLGEVVDLDAAAREVVFNDRRLRYDSLILATGSGSSYFGHEEWRELAPPMKILEHADEIRRRVLTALEEAEQTPDPERCRFLQSVVVVGGGPSGCELAGSINELMRHAARRDFRQLDPGLCRVVLVDPGDRVLRAMDPSLSQAAGDYLVSRGVELVLGGRVQSIEAGRLTVAFKSPAPGTPGERVLEAATICWSAGVRASHLGKLLAERTGCAVDRGGRVVVEPDFSIAGHPEIRVVGDLCSYSHTVDGKPLPGMAGPAVQMGGWVALDLLAQLGGRRQAPFRWFDFGSMAVIGPLCAVADLRGLRFTGPLGWLLWGLAHLAFMPANENRLTLLTKWLWMIATQQRASLLITGRPDQHLGVEVGLERAERAGDPAAPPAVTPAAASTEQPAAA